MKILKIYSVKYGEKEVIIDDEYYDDFFSQKWHLLVCSKKRTFYAVRSDGKLMHRIIMRMDGVNLSIDHIDHNGLNNVRSNLRQATYAQNAKNRSAKKRGTSKYLGVSFNARLLKWQARIRNEDGKNLHLGIFDDEILAAKAYNEAASKIHGDFANINKVA